MIKLYTATPGIPASGWHLSEAGIEQAGLPTESCDQAVVAMRDGRSGRYSTPSGGRLIVPRSWINTEEAVRAAGLGRLRERVLLINECTYVVGYTDLVTLILTVEVMRKNWRDSIDDDSLNDLFRALQNPIRRRLLCSLLDHNPEDTYRVPEDVPTGDVDQERQTILLVRQHLPMLEATGFIRWDRETNEIQMRGKFTQMRNILMAIKEEQEAVNVTAIA